MISVSAEVEEDGEAKESGNSLPSELKEEDRVELLEIRRLFMTGSVSLPEDLVEDTDRFLDKQEQEQVALDEGLLSHEDTSSLRHRHFTAKEGNAIASLPISRAGENGT